MLRSRERYGEWIDRPHPDDALQAPADLDLAPRWRWLRVVHFLGFAGVGVFVAAVAVLHGLRADLNPVQHTISEYSLAEYGWVMRGAFAALGLAAMASAVSLRLRFEPSPRQHFGLLSLTATAVGLVLEAGFNTDHPRVPETFDGTLHGDGMLIVCLTLPAIAFVLGSELARVGAGLAARWLQLLGPLQIIAILGFEVSPIALRGLTERIAVTLGVATLGLVQWCAVRPAGERTRGETARSQSLTLLAAQSGSNWGPDHERDARPNPSGRWMRRH